MQKHFNTQNLIRLESVLLDAVFMLFPIALCVVIKFACGHFIKGTAAQHKEC